MYPRKETMNLSFLKILSVYVFTLPSPNIIVSGLLNIIKCYIGTNKQKKTASTNFTWLCFVFPNSFVFPYSIRIFCNLFICLVFDGLLQSICFWMFCSKHSITFDTYLLSCQFHCVDIFYIKDFHNNKFRGNTFFNWNSLTLELWNVDLSYTCKCMF